MQIIYEDEDSYDEVNLSWIQNNYPELMNEINNIIDRQKDDQIECESGYHSILKFYF